MIGSQDYQQAFLQTVFNGKYIFYYLKYDSKIIDIGLLVFFYKPSVFGLFNMEYILRSQQDLRILLRLCGYIKSKYDRIQGKRATRDRVLLNWVDL